MDRDKYIAISFVCQLHTLLFFQFFVRLASVSYLYIAVPTKHITDQPCYIEYYMRLTYTCTRSSYVAAAVSGVEHYRERLGCIQFEKRYKQY